MSNTIITLNKEYFTVETTKCFLKDFENACLSMELKDFMNLFDKYDLTFIEDYQEVLDLIKNIMSSWKKEGQGTELHKVETFDSKCIFCKIGKSVQVYKWNYQHKLVVPPKNRIVYSNQIAFMFSFENNRLIEFGTCNAYLQQEENS